MAVPFNIQVYFYIFFAILYSAGTHNKKRNADIINNLLQQPGWKNINDVKHIKYRTKDIYPNEIINKPVTLYNCNNYVRHGSIFLGCSYTQDLNVMFFTLYNFYEHCFKLLKSDKVRAHKCTVTLLAKIIDIVPMAKLMEGALNAIEQCHNKPMNIQRKHCVILSDVLTYLKENEHLKKLIPLSIDKDSINAALFKIQKYISRMKLELEENVRFCELISLDLFSLWNLWNMEFNTLNFQGIYQELFIFLSDKINDLILTIICKKYIELGFKFDLNTCQTFLPTPQSNDNQDTTQNPINMIQYATEVNAMKKIVQEYIIQYKNSINLVQPTNEVDKQDGIKKDDVMCEAKDDSNLQIEYTDNMRPYYEFI
ncbi:uncharacterized protein LOC126894417 [Daktulosphaira vitifoliae]|uniref:uncharacterized protein LOC126894417 n=1 Tax=Daktulosphaira vitifoliae TaxID=58002 RepID=UPI0021AAFE7D|nr:uncharacterized protein LOC126894417 [Daktulosphaira vitifoliae]